MALHPQPPVNIISLCTGGYGLDFGIELAMPAARSVCLVEREAFAVARLVAAMQEGLIPEAAIWSDARTFNGRPWRGLVDGVIGGIPCQPHSLAGRRRGAEDPRDLWSIARRTIVQSGAWWCLIENVPGMLSAAKGQRAGAERVWRDLQRLGFAVEGGLFSAAEVGASHERERLFILGVADGLGSGRWGEGDAGKQANRIDASRSSQLADTDIEGSSLAFRQPRDDGQERAAFERVRGNVVDTESVRWREGRPEPEFSQRNGRPAANAIGQVDVTSGFDRILDDPEERFSEADDQWPSPSVGNSLSGGHDRRPHVEIRREIVGAIAEGPSGTAFDKMGDAQGIGYQERTREDGEQNRCSFFESGLDAARAIDLSLFPPPARRHRRMASRARTSAAP